MTSIRGVILQALLIVVATTSVVQAQTIVLWDRGIAASISEQVADQPGCPATPYEIFRGDCHAAVAWQLNRDDTPRMTSVDKLFMFVYRHRDVNLNTDIKPGTKLKFSSKLKTLYEREAEVWVTLKMRF